MRRLTPTALLLLALFSTSCGSGSFSVPTSESPATTAPTAGSSPTSANATPPVSEQWTLIPYADPQGRFTLSYPAGWYAGHDESYGGVDFQSRQLDQRGPPGEPEARISLTVLPKDSADATHEDINGRNFEYAHKQVNGRDIAYILIQESDPALEGDQWDPPLTLYALGRMVEGERALSVAVFSNFKDTAEYEELFWRVLDSIDLQ